MICLYRNGQRGQRPNKPADWTEDEFLYEYNATCINKKYAMIADKVICG